MKPPTSSKLWLHYGLDSWHCAHHAGSWRWSSESSLAPAGEMLNFNFRLDVQLISRFNVGSTSRMYIDSGSALHVDLYSRLRRKSYLSLILCYVVRCFTYSVTHWIFSQVWILCRCSSYHHSVCFQHHQCRNFWPHKSYLILHASFVHLWCLILHSSYLIYCSQYPSASTVSSIWVKWSFVIEHLWHFDDIADIALLIQF